MTIVSGSREGIYGYLPTPTLRPEETSPGRILFYFTPEQKNQLAFTKKAALLFFVAGVIVLSGTRDCQPDRCARLVIGGLTMLGFSALCCGIIAKTFSHGYQEGHGY